jgi:hypothetical protein
MLKIVKEEMSIERSKYYILVEGKYDSQQSKCLLFHIFYLNFFLKIKNISFFCVFGFYGKEENLQIEVMEWMNFFTLWKICTQHPPLHFLLFRFK